MRLVVVLAFVLLAVVGLFLFARNRPESTTPVGEIPESQIPGSDAVIIVEGWSNAELQSILADFLEAYRLPASSLTISNPTGGIRRITIAETLPAYLLAFLINYLHYPKDQNLEGRRITAIAMVTRSELLGAPSELAGRRVIVYVPSNDTEYDQVFVRVDPGDHFRVPFTRLQWLPIADGSEPASLQKLADEALK